MANKAIFVACLFALPSVGAVYGQAESKAGWSEQRISRASYDCSRTMEQELCRDEAKRHDFCEGNRLRQLCDCMSKSITGLLTFVEYVEAGQDAGILKNTGTYTKCIEVISR